jgi:hypothetical protein
MHGLPSEEAKFYLKYIIDTLGVKYFDFVDLVDVVEIEAPSVLNVSWELGFHQSEQNHLLFLLNGQSWESIAPDLKELFLKIRAAMKLNVNIQAPAVVAKWDTITLNQFIATFKSPIELIIFEEDKNLLEPVHRVLGDHTLVVVPSLSLMLKKQDYKKIAWERIRVLAAKLKI